MVNLPQWAGPALKFYPPSKNSNTIILMLKPHISYLHLIFWKK